MIDYSEFEALMPFMNLIEEALADYVDSGSYFDLFADDVVMFFPFAPPGTPPSITGRQTIIDSWRGYGHILRLDHMSNLEVYPTTRPGVIILTYESHGEGVQTGKPYHQSYVSVVTIRDGKVAHWVDYSNPNVVTDTIGGGHHMGEAMFSESGTPPN